MITRELIKRRIENFWGYGSLEAPVWFVGMEEGHDPKANKDDLEERFRAADGKDTVDMRRDMMNVSDHIKFFQPGGPIQPTWGYLIALYLFLKNNVEPTTEDIRKYQTLYLGDSFKKETACIELMPLPSNKADKKSWIYGKYEVEGLSIREDYILTYKDGRVAKLKSLIQEYEPRVVVFYSLGYRKDWEEIIGQNLKEKTKTKRSKIYFNKTEDTSFIVTPHPAALRMTYGDLYKFADEIRGSISI